jgi:hypothetical protein
MTSSIATRKTQELTHTITNKPLRSHIPFCLAIAAISLLSYWKSLQCFFFADDLLCLDYLQDIFSGKPQLLLQRLTSPWQDPSISLLYRPLADLTLVFDYSFWKANPVGYHLSNLILHTAAAISCFLFVDLLLRTAKMIRTKVPAFLSAAIFAAYPLHVEPVLWICCRTDLASTSLVLIFLWASIRRWNSNTKAVSSEYFDQTIYPGALACMAYIGALMFKESAACALPILIIYLLFFSHLRTQSHLVARQTDHKRAEGASQISPAPHTNSVGLMSCTATGEGGSPGEAMGGPDARSPSGSESLSKNGSLQDAGAPQSKYGEGKILAVIKSSRSWIFERILQPIIPVAMFAGPFVGLTIVYSIVRLMVLGTFSGGYMGALGAALVGSWWNRIFDPEIPALLALAANVTVFKEGNLLFTCLHVVFFCMAGVLICRIPFLPWSSNTCRLLIFLSGASICAIAPALQVAGITPTLTNARVFYLASAFFIPLAVLAVYPASESTSDGNLQKRLRMASTIILGTLAAIYMCMCNFAIDPWLEGSKILRALQAQTVEKIIQSRKLSGEGAKVTILNIPASVGGAHLMYEFRELATLVGPAFYPGKDYSRSLQALDEYPDFMAARMQLLAPDLYNPQRRAFWFSQKTRKLLGIFQSSARNFTSKESPLIPRAEHRFHLVSGGNSFHTKQSSLENQAIKAHWRLMRKLGIGGRSAEVGAISGPSKSAVRGQNEYLVTTQPGIMDALSADQIEIEVNFRRFAGRPVLAVALTDGKTIPEDDELFFFMLEYGKHGKQTFTVPANILCRAIDLGIRKQIYFRLSEGSELLSVRLVPGDQLARCIVQGSDIEKSQNGKYLLRESQNPILKIDVSDVQNAAGIYLELSKANHFLHFASINAHNPVPSKHKLSSWNFAVTECEARLDRGLLADNAIYQIRACATDANGNLVGYFSDPIEFDLRKETTNHKNFY